MTYYLEVQGSVLQIKEKTVWGDGREKGSSKRGVVFDFSKKSRKRLIELFNRMDLTDKRTVFVTLTFSNIPSISDATQAFKRFISRMCYKYQNFCCVWRKEFQKRGAVHYHLLCWNLPFIKQSLLQEIWTECTREDRSIVDIRLVHSKKHALRYVSKYLGKVGDDGVSTSLETLPYSQNEEKVSVGRLWGIVNREVLPMAELCCVRVDNLASLFYLKFTMRSISGGSIAKKTLACMLFSDEAEMLFNRFLEVCDEITVGIGKAWHWIEANTRNDWMFERDFNYIPSLGGVGRAGG